MYRIQDGQLAEGWFVEDDASTFEQLGSLDQIRD